MPKEVIYYTVSDIKDILKHNHPDHIIELDDHFECNISDNETLFKATMDKLVVDTISTQDKKK